MTQILILGGVSYNTMIYLDAFPRPEPQTIFSQGVHETVGSTGAGKALNLQKLGLKVVLHGLIGDDEYGDKIKAHLAKEAIDFVYDIDPQGSKRHVNLMDPNGGRISIFIASGSFEPEVDEGRIEALITASDLVVLNILNYCRRFIPFIRQQGKPIWCDLHDYDGHNPFHQDFIEAADVLFLSSGTMLDIRRFMEKQIAGGKALVVATHGKAGATALSGTAGWIETPIIADYEAIDSNGAGDAFFAGVLYGHLKGYGLEQSLRLGAIAAGRCVTSRELAFPGLSEQLLLDDYTKYYRSRLLR